MLAVGWLAAKGVNSLEKDSLKIAKARKELATIKDRVDKEERRRRDDDRETREFLSAPPPMIVATAADCNMVFGPWTVRHFMGKPYMLSFVRGRMHAELGTVDDPATIEVFRWSAYAPPKLRVRVAKGQQSRLWSAIFGAANRRLAQEGAPTTASGGLFSSGGVQAAGGQRQAAGGQRQAVGGQRQAVGENKQKQKREASGSSRDVNDGWLNIMDAPLPEADTVGTSSGESETESETETEDETEDEERFVDCRYDMGADVAVFVQSGEFSKRRVDAKQRLGRGHKIVATVRINHVGYGFVDANAKRGAKIDPQIRVLVKSILVLSPPDRWRPNHPEAVPI
jgi:hypothetical protein